MAEIIKTRWLTDNVGNKVAPKTLASQVLNDDGSLFKDGIEDMIEDATQAITVERVHEICGATYVAASEVDF